jgi:hypothetical protein
MEPMSERLSPAWVFGMFLRNLYPEHADCVDEINNAWRKDKANALKLEFDAVEKVIDILKRAAREGDIQVWDDDVGLIDMMECRRGELDLFGDVDYDAGIFTRSPDAGGILTVVESRSRREYLHIRFGRAGVVKVLQQELAKKRVEPQLQAELAKISGTDTTAETATPDTPPARLPPGPSPTYDYDLLKEEAFRLFRERGLPARNTINKKWRTRADLERALGDFITNQSGGEEPARSTLQRFAQRTIDDWKQQQADNDR